MKKRCLLISLFSLVLMGQSRKISSDIWIVEKHAGYDLFFTETDKKNKDEYLSLIDHGISSVKSFFGSAFKNEFRVFVHPDRQSLDRQWAKDWNMPTFKSECWMVASGVAARLNMISPVNWDKESCEHTFTDKTATQQLITHELVHVYHGQLNISPDFIDVTGIDWFVEGLATYASGQCDSTKLKEIKKAVAENSITVSLDSFWTGKLRYCLSGSLVMYIDHKFGRSKLTELLKFNRRSELLDSLQVTETDLLNGWLRFIKTL